VGLEIFEKSVWTMSQQRVCRIITEPPTTSFFFSPNILLIILFISNLSLFSPLNFRDQVSCPYKPHGLTTNTKPLNKDGQYPGLSSNESPTYHYNVNDRYIVYWIY
jgi:hypothetical protein